MVLSALITTVSALALLLFVLFFSLFLSGIERVVYEKKDISFSMDLIVRFLTGKSYGNRPPMKLYLACVSLLVVFLFFPMGTLPQFFTTDFDTLIVVFLLAIAQGFFIRGMRGFSEDIYQTLDKGELSAIPRFITAYILIGGTVSWYLIARGVPGKTLSFDALTATPLWEIMGSTGRVGVVSFFLLFVVTAPFRKVDRVTIYYNMPLPEIFDALRSTLAPVVVTAAFVPWNPAVYMGLYGWRMFTVGFAFYWLEVAAMQLFVFPLIWKIYLKAQSKLPARYAHAFVVILAALGICCFLMDLYV